MSNALGYIGLAKKAGAIAIGETDTGAVLRAGKGRLLLLASDASDNARHRALNFVEGTQTPMITLPFTKAELSQATGESGCSMAAFTEIGLASAFAQALAEDEPSYAETAGRLTAKNEKALMRKREAAVHEKKLKQGRAAEPAAGKRRRNV